MMTLDLTDIEALIDQSSALIEQSRRVRETVREERKRVRQVREALCHDVTSKVHKRNRPNTDER